MFWEVPERTPKFLRILLGNFKKKKKFRKFIGLLRRISTIIS